MTAGRKGGSGFIFDTEGTTAFVVTNHHVVEDEDAIDVRVENTRTYKATLLGYDSDKDVAVMSICCNSSFTALAWDSEASAEVGDKVVAVGYPRASSSRVTATLGEVNNDWLGVALGYIAHDAPLNPGNSGGPLFSMEGKVLGVNTGSSTTTGLFYALPYSTIEDDVADWKSRLVVTTDPSPTPTPAPSTDLMLSGSGESTEFMALDAGRHLVTTTISDNCYSSSSCDALFSIKIEGLLGGFEYESWWITEGTRLFLMTVRESNQGSHLITVTAQGQWTITFEPQ